MLFIFLGFFSVRLENREPEINQLINFISNDQQYQLQLRDVYQMMMIEN